MSDKKYRCLKLNEYDIGDIIKIFPLGRMKVARSRRTNELIIIKMLNKSLYLLPKSF